MKKHASLPSLNDYEVIKIISKGAYGSVFLSRKLSTGDLFAVKVLKRTDNEKTNQNFIKERNIMMLLDSPYIAKLYYALASKDNFYLVLEFINGGDCFSLLQSIGFLDENLCRIYAAEIVSALSNMHMHVFLFSFASYII